jgi:pimeloyl-ACP methyl ester carboxylesterase
VLAYDALGTGPVVLLLHAGVADRSMWREHLDWLAEAGFKAVAVDLPGFGETPVTPGVQAPWEDVLQTLKELDVDGPALVGNSFGAAVALRVAAVAPATVSRLMLVSPPPLKLDPSPELSAAWQAEEAALERGDIDGAVAAVLKAWLQPAAPPGLRERVAAMQRRALELQRVASEVQEAQDPLEDHPDLLNRLRVPVLAAAGEHDMPDFKAGAAEIAELVRSGKVTVIQGAGHLAPLEAPETFKQLLLDFLADSA